MKKLLLFLSCFAALLLAQEANPSAEDLIKENRIKEIDIKLNKENIWLDKYDNFARYKLIQTRIEKLKAQVAKLEISKLHKNKTELNNIKMQINSLKHQIDTLILQQSLLGEHKDTPFAELITAPKIEVMPKITNPIAIISGLNYLKSIDNQKKMFHTRLEVLQETLKLVDEKYNLLLSLSDQKTSTTKEPSPAALPALPSPSLDINLLDDRLYKVSTMRLELQSAAYLLNTSVSLFDKNTEEVKLKVIALIRAQIIKLIYIGAAILVSILLAFLAKYTIRKYVHGNDRVYTLAKAINFFNILTILLILMFAYMENVTYLVAFIGFASAGLAIAMKDLFMSILGWFVIVIGGSVHVGDRIKITKDNETYIGDVLDISMLRMTLYEDLTLQTIETNRRAGRVIFIPNNYVFTTMIANYTHGGVHTIWDGIDFTITFDSDYKKAIKIANEVAMKYSKGYTEVTRKQLNKLRDKYSLRNINTEPQAFSLLCQNGIKISVWYETNAYSVLMLRSTISGEILDRFLAEEGIFVAYNTTKLIKTTGDGFNTKLPWDA